MSKIFIAPIGIVAGLIAGFISQKIFTVIWARVSDREAPEPDQREIRMAELVAALALQGALFRVIKGLVDRSTRSGFAHLTGVWPGETRQDVD